MRADHANRCRPSHCSMLTLPNTFATAFQQHNQMHDHGHHHHSAAVRVHLPPSLNSVSLNSPITLHWVSAWQCTTTGGPLQPQRPSLAAV